MHALCIKKLNKLSRSMSPMCKKKKRGKNCCKPVQAKVNRNGRNNGFSKHSFLPHKLHSQTLKIFQAMPLQMQLYKRSLPGHSNSIIFFVDTPYAFGRLLKGTQLHNWLLNGLKCIDKAYKPL